jgi:hypothetical protein
MEKTYTYRLSVKSNAEMQIMCKGVYIVAYGAGVHFILRFSCCWTKQIFRSRVIYTAGGIDVRQCVFIWSYNHRVLVTV